MQNNQQVTFLLSFHLKSKKAGIFQINGSNFNENYNLNQMEKISEKLEQVLKQVNMLCDIATVGRIEQRQDDEICVRSSKPKQKNRTEKEPRQTSRQDSGQHRRNNEEGKDKDKHINIHKDEHNRSNRTMAPRVQKSEQSLLGISIFIQQNFAYFDNLYPDLPINKRYDVMFQTWCKISDIHKKKCIEAELMMSPNSQKYCGQKEKKKVTENRRKKRDMKEINNQSKEIKDKKEEQRSQSDCVLENENS